MRNIVGKPVSGKDFFRRENITKTIYRRLETGANLFMSAPRRVGKTSIMYHLKDRAAKGFDFIYVNTESINDPEQFFKSLFDALLESEAISRTIKASEQSKGLWDRICERIKTVSAFGIELEFEEKRQEKYSDIFTDLTKRLKPDETQIVVMIDEFPSTVENIHQKEGIPAAAHFLKLNRTLRQESAGGIQFIYTGSIGLPAIVKRLDTPESINDLNLIEITPLSEEEGMLFTTLLLEGAGVAFQTEAIKYLLEKINWLMPFFIQLSVQHLIDLYDQKQQTVSLETVEVAFDQICNHKNNVHFDSYYNRLKDAFSPEDYESALNLLNSIAEKDMVSKEKLFANTNSDERKRLLNGILESLEYDGYISSIGGDYHFNSPILQVWWNKYIRT